jgi:hypothetical protein
VATAAVKASAAVGDSEPSEAALCGLLLKPFHELLSPDELLHNLHFLLLPPSFTFKHKPERKKKKQSQQQ